MGNSSSSNSNNTYYSQSQDITWNYTYDSASTIIIGTNKIDLTANATTLKEQLGSISSHSSIVIPDNIEGCKVIGIGNYAFYNCSHITSITLPNTLTFISEHAFQGCTGLKTITIPNSVISLDYQSFYNTNLLNVILPVRFFGHTKDGTFSMSSTNTYVKNANYYKWLFSLAHDLQASAMGHYHTISNQQYYGIAKGSPNAWMTVHWGNTFGWTTSAKGWASYFIGTPSVSSVPLNVAISNLNKNGTIFKFYCILTTINNGSITTNEITTQLYGYEPGQTLGGITQSSTPNLDITFDDSVISFNELVSFQNTYVSSITIPDVSDIGIVFEDNVTLYSVRFNKNNTKEMSNIGSNAFIGCTNLINIIIPKYITSIGTNAFNGCTSLIGSPNNNKLNLQSITSIGSNAFKGCTSIVEVSILETSLQSIGPYAFFGCTNLEYINLPKNIEYTTVAENTFCNCTSLITITIPINVTQIDTAAFCMCSNLNTVYFNNGLTVIGSEAFKGCSSLSFINTPSSLGQIDINAFHGCDKLSIFTLSTQYFNNNIDQFINNIWNYNVFGMSLIVKSLYNSNDYQFYSNIVGLVVDANNNPLAGTITPYSSDFTTLRGQSAYTNMLTNIDDKINFQVDVTCALINNTTDLIGFQYTNEEGNISSNVSVTYASLKWKNESSVPLANGNTVGNTSGYELYFQVSNVVKTGPKIEYYYIFAPETPGSTTLTSTDVFNLINKWKLTDIYTIGLFNAYIADSVTIIDTNAFKNCENIATISIGYRVEEIRGGAFEGCTALKNFYIGTNIDAINNSKLTTIGDYAFNGCNIESIIIPTNVTTLGKWIFYNATNLKEVVFYSDTHIETIDNYAFANCTNLELLRIPNSVKHINTGAFMNCTNLFNILLPQTLETIGELAFENCNAISQLSVPYSVTNISNSAFRNIEFAYNSNISISSLFKNNINSIFNYQTYSGPSIVYNENYQDNLATYNYYTWLKNGMTGIANSQMGSDNHTINSQTSYFGNNPTYISKMISTYGSEQAKPLAEVYLQIDATTGNSLADKDIDKSYFSMKNSLMKLSSIPDTYTDISSLIFQYHYDISSNMNTLTKEQVQEDMSGVTSSFSASINNNITIIGESVFENFKISNIELNEKLTDICNNAFKGTPLYGILKIPSSVQFIGDSAFQDCSGLTTIIIPDGTIETIGENAFRGCNISTIYIPKSVTSIGNGAFIDCPNLTIVTLPIDPSGNVPIYTSSTLDKSNYFDNSNNNVKYEYIVNIYPEESVLDSITQYAITDTIVTNALGQFDDKFTAMIKHKDASQIGNIKINASAFSGTNILRVHIGNSVTEIGTNAFANCPYLKSVSIGNSIESIDKGAFINCLAMKTVKIPSRFYDKCNMNYFSSKLSIIYFYYCILISKDSGGILSEYDVFDQFSIGDTFNSTISVIFDPSVTIIDDNAFNGNQYIDNIIIPDTIRSIGQNAFSNCSNLGSVICQNINPQLSTIGSNAFNGCNHLSIVKLPLSLLSIEYGAFLACDKLWSIYLPKIFDYKYFTEINTYFESNMMKNESWKSDDEWAAGGSFFTFNFELRKGTYHSYSWSKNNYMAKQRAKQSKKVAAHKKVIHTWNEIGEDVAVFAVAVLLTVAIIFTGGAVLAVAPEFGALFMGGEAATDAGVEAGVAAGAEGGAETGAEGGAEGGADSSSISDTTSHAAKHTAVGMLIIHPIDILVVSPFFSSLSNISNNNSYYIEQISPRESLYGSMNSIYTIPGNIISDSIDTQHSSGSWKIITTIKIQNNQINLNELTNKFKQIINTNIPSGTNSMTIQTNHSINNKNHTYTFTATIPTDYTLITNNDKSIMTNTINSSLSDYLAINTNINQNSISTIISNTCFPKNTPINTDQGIIAIEKIDTNIHTVNNNSIVAITKTTSMDSYLIGFKKHALGINYPKEDTVMSKDHKIKYNGQFIEAKKFLQKFTNVYKVGYSGEILYNVLLDKYSTILVNNLHCETLNPTNLVAKLYRDFNKIPEKDRLKIIETIKKNTKNMSKLNESTRNNTLKQIKFTK